MKQLVNLSNRSDKELDELVDNRIEANRKKTNIQLIESIRMESLIMKMRYQEF